MTLCKISQHSGVKLQSTAPLCFCVGSACFAKRQTIHKIQTNRKYEETKNTKRFRLPRLQGAVNCSLAKKILKFPYFFPILKKTNKYLSNQSYRT